VNTSLILSNFLNPPVLFFFLGMLAIFLKSDLEIPAPLPKLFSLLALTFPFNIIVRIPVYMNIVKMMGIGV
jgi:hypothetical protein